MDENVIYNQNKQEQPADGAPPPDQPGEIPTDVSIQAPAETPVAEGEVAAVDETSVDPAAPEATAEVVQEESTGDETTSEEYVPPPPGGIAALLAGGNMKKIIIGVVIVIILIVLVAIFLPRNATSENVELTWYGLWEDEQTVKPLIDEFEKENPNIKIKYEKQDPNQYRERLMARIEKGTGPDIFRYHNTWYPMLSETLLPLSEDVITPDEFKKVYYPVIQNDLIHNGAIYGIPLGADTLALFVNDELFEKAGLAPPKNWDEFVKASKQLTVYDHDAKEIKTAGAALGTYGNVTHAPDILSMMFVQQGIKIPDITNTKTSKNEKDALEFYTSFAKGDEEEVVWNKKLDASMLAFARGNLAMYFGYSWDAFQIKSINPDLKFTIYPVPDLYGKNTTIASYWVEGVSSKSPHTKEALQFMHYLAQKETAQKFYSESAKTRGFGEPYARMDLAESLKNNKLVYPFVSQLKNATSSYFASDTYDGESGLNTTLNGYLEKAVTSLTETNNSGDSTMNNFNQGVSQTYEKYGITPEQSTQ